MQAQVVHPRRQVLPWIPMLLAALFVFATVASIQIALRDRGVTAPAISTVDEGGVRSVGGHGSARIPAGEDAAVSSQKAAMVEAGITSVGGSGSAESTGDTAAAAQKAGMVQAGVTSVGGGSKAAGRDPALEATITRIEQAR